MRILDDGGFPMMSEAEVQTIDNLLEKLQPKNCLEWGSGNSTVYFPKKHSCIKYWLAMEHNRTYFELLGDYLLKDVAEIKVITDFNYVSYPATLEKKFDFILVDGLWRMECVDKAFSVVSDGGVILLHDAFRQESAKIVEKYKGKYTVLSQGEKLLNTGYYAHRGLISFDL